MIPTLYIKVLNPSLKSLYESRLNYSTDSGVDLFCPVYHVIEKNSTYKIDFQIQCQMKLGDEYIPYYLVPRSSISKTPLRMSNSIGIIDSEYLGNICAYVDHTNYGVNKTSDDSPLIVNKGERLFQIVSPNLSPIKVKIVDELRNTTRGSNGFGSTGK